MRVLFYIDKWECFFVRFSADKRAKVLGRFS